MRNSATYFKTWMFKPYYFTIKLIVHSEWIVLENIVNSHFSLGRVSILFKRSPSKSSMLNECILSSHRPVCSTLVK